jgi:hypothetical protein
MMADNGTSSCIIYNLTGKIQELDFTFQYFSTGTKSSLR